MANIVVITLLSCIAIAHCSAFSDETCSASCDKSFEDQQKSLTCKHGCRFYSLIHIISPPGSNKNLTAESCVLACREVSDRKELQDTCTVGCTLQRIFVTKNEEHLTDGPLMEALLETDNGRLASEDIIKQFMEFNARMQLFAEQLIGDFLNEDVQLKDGGASETILQVHESSFDSPASSASLNVRTYSVDEDGRVTLVDELNHEYTFIYSCFSLQIDAPFQRRLKQLIAEPIRTFKRLFSRENSPKHVEESQLRIVGIPGGTVEIKQTNVLQLASESEAQSIIGAQVDGSEMGMIETLSRRDFDWFFCVAARNNRLHCILLALFALSCIGLLCACWVTLGHFSGGRNVNRSDSSCCVDTESCYADEDDEQLIKKATPSELDWDSPLAPPAYVISSPDVAFSVAIVDTNSNSEKAGIPACVNDTDDVMLSVEAEISCEKAQKSVVQEV